MVFSKSSYIKVTSCWLIRNDIGASAQTMNENIRGITVEVTKISEEEEQKQIFFDSAYFYRKHHKKYPYYEASLRDDLSLEPGKYLVEVYHSLQMGKPLLSKEFTIEECSEIA